VISRTNITRAVGRHSIWWTFGSCCNVWLWLWFICSQQSSSIIKQHVQLMSWTARQRPICAGNVTSYSTLGLDSKE